MHRHLERLGKWPRTVSLSLPMAAFNPCPSLPSGAFVCQEKSPTFFGIGSSMDGIHWRQRWKHEKEPTMNTLNTSNGSLLGRCCRVASRSPQWGWPRAPPRPTHGAHISGAQGNRCLRPTSFGTRMSATPVTGSTTGSRPVAVTLSMRDLVHRRILGASPACACPGCNARDG